VKIKKHDWRRTICRATNNSSSISIGATERICRRVELEILAAMPAATAKPAAAPGTFTFLKQGVVLPPPGAQMAALRCQRRPRRGSPPP